MCISTNKQISETRVKYLTSNIFALICSLSNIFFTASSSGVFSNALAYDIEYYDGVEYIYIYIHVRQIYKREIRFFILDIEEGEGWCVQTKGFLHVVTITTSQNISNSRKNGNVQEECVSFFYTFSLASNSRSNILIHGVSGSSSSWAQAKAVLLVFKRKKIHN